jgi:hypothetical protein
MCSTNLGCVQLTITPMDIDFQVVTPQDNTGNSIISLLSHISPKMSITVESICLPILLIIALSFILRCLPPEYMDSEVQQLVYGVQYIFADTMGSIIADSGLETLIAIVGFLNLPLVNDDNSNGYQAFHIYIGGLRMAWVNIMVGIIVPNREWASSQELDVVIALSLSMLFQIVGTIVEGLSSMQGYIEWRIALAIIACMEAHQTYGLDAILATSIILSVLLGVNSFYTQHEGVSVLNTLVSVGTLVWVCTSSRFVIDRLILLAGYDLLTIGFVAVVIFGITYDFISSHTWFRVYTRVV